MLFKYWINIHQVYFYKHQNLINFGYNIINHLLVLLIFDCKVTKNYFIVLLLILILSMHNLKYFVCKNLQFVLKKQIDRPKIQFQNFISFYIVFNITFRNFLVLVFHILIYLNFLSIFVFLHQSLQDKYPSFIQSFQFHLSVKYYPEKFIFFLSSLQYRVFLSMPPPTIINTIQFNPRIRNFSIIVYMLSKRKIQEKIESFLLQ